MRAQHRYDRGGFVIALAVTTAVAAYAAWGETATSASRFVPWAPRGSLATDAVVVREAVRTWDHGVSFLAGAPDPATPPVPPQPHSDVRVLLAESVAGGRVVVAQAHAADGAPELGMFFTATSAPADLRFTSKRVVKSPPPASTHHVAFLVVNRANQALLVVVGEPGTTAVSYATEAAPDVLVPMTVRDGVAAALAPGAARVVVTGADGVSRTAPVTDVAVAPDAVLAGYSARQSEPRVWQGTLSDGQIPEHMQPVGTSV